jgi:hypothetical protein
MPQEIPDPSAIPPQSRIRLSLRRLQGPSQRPEGKMQSVNGEPGSFRGDPAAGRAGFEITKRVLFLAFLIGTMLIPLYMIRGLVEERFGLSQNVARRSPDSGAAPSSSPVRW